MIWDEVLGESLTNRVDPLSLRPDGVLEVMTRTPEAEDELQQRAPSLVEAIQTRLGPNAPVTAITSRGLSDIDVLVTGCPHYDDQAAVETVLLETWHDSLAVHGARPVTFLHTGETIVDRVTSGWAAQYISSELDLELKEPDLAATSMAATTIRPRANDVANGRDARAIRDETLIARAPDYCLAFLTDPDNPTRLATLAATAGIPTRTYTA